MRARVTSESRLNTDANHDLSREVEIHFALCPVVDSVYTRYEKTSGVQMMLSREVSLKDGLAAESIIFL